MKADSLSHHILESFSCINVIVFTLDRCSFGQVILVEIAEWKNIRQLPFKNKVIDFRKSKVNDKLKVPLLVMFIHGKKTLEQMTSKKDICNALYVHKIQHCTSNLMGSSKASHIIRWN